MSFRVLPKKTLDAVAAAVTADLLRADLDQVPVEIVWEQETRDWVEDGHRRREPTGGSRYVITLAPWSSEYSPEVPPPDYRDLLKKFIREAEEHGGCTFLDAERGWTSFTEEEWAELQALAREAGTAHAGEPEEAP